MITILTIITFAQWNYIHYHRNPDYTIELTENYIGVINPETGETIYFESFDSNQPLGKAIIKDNN